MRIYKTLNIGEFHTNHCEDFLVEEQITAEQKMIAVLDGCTMGKESVFASILYGKILRNISKELFYNDFISNTPNNLKAKLKHIVKLIIEKTKLIKNQLGLETNELLSTLVIGIIDTKNASAEFLTVGDGLICHDGKIIEYDQNDKPDYLGYHLSEDFETWFESQTQKLSIANFKDLSISTDGIFSFKNLKDNSKQKTEEEIVHFLLIDKHGVEFENFLDRKIRTLETQGHVVTDDLAVIRLING